jgi:hypothetical protein
MTLRHRSVSLAFALATLLVGACRPGDGSAPAPPVLTVTASPYHFEAPDTVPAGLTTLRLVTKGPELHQFALIRIGGGKTFAQFMDRLKQAGPPPDWVSMAGGVDPPRPGANAEVTMVLEPGTYAIVCFLQTPEGLPHVVKGEYRELTVVPSRRNSVAEPVATDTLVAYDFGFTTSRPITAGHRTFLFINKGPQAHEVTVVRLAPGKSAADYAAWFNTQKGPPPGEPLGGVFTMRTDQRAFFSVDFTPGEYALLCFSPDEKDGLSHESHGMIRQITVR